MVRGGVTYHAGTDSVRGDWVLLGSVASDVDGMSTYSLCVIIDDMTADVSVFPAVGDRTAGTDVLSTAMNDMGNWLVEMVSNCDPVCPDVGVYLANVGKLESSGAFCVVWPVICSVSLTVLDFSVFCCVTEAHLYLVSAVSPCSGCMSKHK